MEAYTLGFFDIILSFFNLNCVFLRKNKLHSSWPVKRVAFMITFLIIIQTLTFFCCYYKFFFLKLSFEVIDLVELAMVTFGYLQYHIDLFFVYKYGRDSRLNYFCLYKNIDQNLGVIDEMHIAIKKKILLYCSIFASAWFVSSLIDIVVFIPGFMSILPTVTTAVNFFCYNFYFFLKTLTILDFMSQVLLIEYRLKIIVNILEYYFNECVTKYGIQDVTTSSFINLNIPHVCELNTTDLNITNDEMLMIVTCYLHLIKQANHVNEMYGFRILMSCTSLIFDIVFFLSLAYNALVRIMRQFTFGYLAPISNIFRVLDGCIVLLCFIHRCEQCYKQTANIINIADDLLFIKQTDPQLKKIVKELRDLVHSRPISFTAANFFRIDYVLLVSIASACITYTIIITKT